jgi:hypothetical protein
MAKRAQIVHHRITDSTATTPAAPDENSIVRRLAMALGIDAHAVAIDKLPFVGADVTLGVENEYQAAVAGEAHAVDLPCLIRDSNYYRNLLRRTAAGDTAPQSVQRLDSFLTDNPARVWENSWVRFPRSCLSAYTLSVWESDLLDNKRQPNGALRCDADQFTITAGGESFLRIPVSYMLKLALAEAIASPGTDPTVRRIGQLAMGHFLNDNTSPETFSFHPVQGVLGMPPGVEAAGETLKRYLLSQLLTQFAGHAFKLFESGQRPLIYFAPNPPFRQRQLSALITDSFYRQLFMSPCLSGWDCGQQKHRYMVLCHEVLARSQLNAVAKLREAGIILNNLVVLPNLSNVSLANNGTHLSIGSQRLAALLAGNHAGFGGGVEKCLGDLAIKIVEHFLPLFVGTYSAAPGRFDFQEFHPERVLGFLPHELDFTHLRMLWRRWKKKARNRVFGRPLTPFGPEWLDRFIQKVFRLRGDLVPDARLIDYLVCLLSTEQSPGLDGTQDNEQRLKSDLAAMGAFDPAMAIYLLYRLRRYEKMGFSGFEGRHYSLFHRHGLDMAPAANLQCLLTALAYQQILRGAVTHGQIPDRPWIESERRQIVFSAAIGLPTVYVLRDTPNRFLATLLSEVGHCRASRRYPGYWRVPVDEYRQGLIRYLKREGAGLIEAMGMAPCLADLEQRIREPACGAGGRLIQGLLDHVGARHPFELNAAEFAGAAEAYYRDRLRLEHISEAFEMLRPQVAALDSYATWRQGHYMRPLLSLLGGASALEFWQRAETGVKAESLPLSELRRAIHLILLGLHRDGSLAPPAPASSMTSDGPAA